MGRRSVACLSLERMAGNVYKWRLPQRNIDKEETYRCRREGTAPSLNNVFVHAAIAVGIWGGVEKWDKKANKNWHREGG